MSREVIGRIEHIMYHPVKSGGAIETDTAILGKEGIVGDRQFMVVQATPDGDGIFHFVTQRDRRSKTDKPQGLAVMSHIKPLVAGDSLYLTWQGLDPIEVPMDVNAGREIPVQIWDDLARVIDQGDALADWLSSHLNHGVRLVKAAGSAFARRASQSYMLNDNRLRFQDAYPGHWFSQDSVDALSASAGEQVPWQSFRPNIVISGGLPEIEHAVLSGQFGDVPFLNPKPCVRCPITNIDQATGEIRHGRALRPLSQYKRWRSKSGDVGVIFGENMILQAEGTIHVGDEVVLTERRNPPLVFGAKV